MSAKNHTQIDHLIEEETNKKKKQPESVSVSKEGEPIKSPESKVEHKIEFPEAEPQIEDKEVEKYVEVEQHEPIIDEELKNAGLQAVDSSSLDPRYHVDLPISDEKVYEGLDKPVNSSWRWLSELAVFLLRAAHLHLKKIHGKVVRVIRK